MDHPKDKRRFKKKLNFSWNYKGKLITTGWPRAGQVILLRKENGHEFNAMVQHCPAMYNELVSVLTMIDMMTTHYEKELPESVKVRLWIQKGDIESLLTKMEAA